MAGLEKLRNVLHVIRAALYPNYLEHGGKYIARAKTEQTLTVEQVCTEAVTRGGSGLNYDTMVEAVKVYFDEAFYQLSDGFSVENDFFSLHPKIGGTFDFEHIGHVDKTKNPVSFTFRLRQAAREALDRISVEIEGVADSGAYIAEVLDIASATVDEKLTSNKVITILGSRIKIAGDNPNCGVYIQLPEKPLSIKITGNLVENRSSRVSAQMPTLVPQTAKVYIVTQYAGSGKFLKEPRTIKFDVLFNIVQ